MQNEVRDNYSGGSFNQGASAYGLTLSERLALKRGSLF
jgi:hypothetical protein